MKLQFETFDAPAYWASALINADTSGMSDDEEADMDQWLEANAIGPVVDCADAGIGRFDGLLCDLCTYTHQIL